MPFKPEIISEIMHEHPSPNLNIEQEAGGSEPDDYELEVSSLKAKSTWTNQLEHDVAALFLKMTSALNISETALQDVKEKIKKNSYSITAIDAFLNTRNTKSAW